MFHMSAPQTLKNIDKEIVLNADTYEDFIGKFTDSDYIKASKPEWSKGAVCKTDFRRWLRLPPSRLGKIQVSLALLSLLGRFKSTPHSTKNLRFSMAGIGGFLYEIEDGCQPGL